MKVLKFGGSSVANAANIELTTAVVSEAAKSGRCVVVLSAMQGVTDRIIAAGRAAETGDERFREEVAAIAADHTTAVQSLFRNGVPASLAQELEANFEQLLEVCEGVARVRELTHRTLDSILCCGELASSRVVSAKLIADGLPNVWLDSRDLIRTDRAYGNAAVDHTETEKLINENLSGRDAGLVVVPGFIASAADGSTTTLGRGGSDYTAAIFAAALDADALEIWTDVSGMMSADPRYVRGVRHIPRINYREAMELSHFGAKVIYPPTIQPVMAKGIPVVVKNTFAPNDTGTEIVPETELADGIIRGITSIDKIALISLEGSGMVGVPGFSKRLFEALSLASINVILITQSSSEHSICVAVDERSADAAADAANREFANEIKLGSIEPVTVERRASILAIVGDQMRHHTGISGRMFMALGANGINIRAIAQGSSERNISAVIASEDVRKAVNTLHEEFFSDGNRQVNLFIAGVGTVGSRLLEQISRQQDHLADELRLNLRIVGIANSKGHVIDEAGIDAGQAMELLSRADPSSIDKFSAAIAKLNLRNSIFVDITASDAVVATYPELLRRSVSVVACNKIAAASDLAKYKHLKDLAREFNADLLFETNVGAGLPVIQTLNDLIRSGDRVRRIEAVLSGTLNFIFNSYDGSRPFHAVVRQAQDEGYTEPDPRLDLNGADVARKILILAREAGHGLEFADVRNKSFVPEECFEGSVEEFYSSLERTEAHFRALLEHAEKQNAILKYVARFDTAVATAGLETLPHDHEFARLSGKDNAVLFYTDRYSEQPLVVKGAGAGADVTAAGVFADIIRAARSGSRFN